MVTNCLNKVSSYLPSFSEEDSAYYKGMAAAGVVFAAGSFLGWNAFVNQNLFSWQNASVALLGAYTFSGRSISVFPDFQSRVEKLHKEIAEASLEHLQQNLNAYSVRCLALGNELISLPEHKTTPYQSFVLVKIRDFLLADSKSRSAIHDELIKLNSYELRMKAVRKANMSASYNRGIAKVLLATAGVSSVVGLAAGTRLAMSFGSNIDHETVSLINKMFLGSLSFISGFGSLLFYQYYTEKKHLAVYQDVYQKEKMQTAVNKNDLDALKELTGTKNHLAFQACNDISSFFRKLFPTTTSELPKDWEKIVKTKISKDPALEEFEEVADQLLKNKSKFIPWKDLAAKLRKTTDRSVNTLVELLKESNPLFKRACELAGNPKFQELPSSETALGDYDFWIHTISIDKNAPTHIKVETIIFEIFNALQSSSLYKSCFLSKDQNEAALLKEWIESFSANWSAKINHSLGYPLKTLSFPEYWKKVNELQMNEVISQHVTHAEWYRIMWMIKYITDHPEFLPRRLQELQGS